MRSGRRLEHGPDAARDVVVHEPGVLDERGDVATTAIGERHKAFAVLAAFAALAAITLVWWRTLDLPFLWDDHYVIERDASFRHGSLASLFTRGYWSANALSDARPAYFRPLVLLTFRLDSLITDDAEQYHCTSTLIHVAAAALLMAVARRLGARPAAAVLAGLAWALLPRHTEAVAWISARGDVLVAALGLGALALLPRSPGGHRWPRFAAAVVLLAGALFAKETALAFLAASAVALLLAPVGARRLAALPLLALAAYLPLRFVALSSAPSLQATPLGAWKRLLTVFESIGRYAQMTVDPFHSASTIGLVGEPSLLHAALGLGVAVALGGVLWRARGRLAYGEAVGLTLALVPLALVVHVVPLTLGGAVTADRFLYLPNAGLTLTLAVAGNRLPRWPARVAGGLALVLAGALAFATRARLDDYRSELVFWTKAARSAHPHNTMARNALAGALVNLPKPILACRLYRRSRAVLEATGRGGSLAHRRTRENIAQCDARIGEYQTSLEESERLTTEYPSVGRIWYALGYARLHQLDVRGAEAAWTEAARLDPTLADAARREIAGLPEVRSLSALYASKVGSSGERAASEDAAAYLDFLGRVGRVTDALRIAQRIALDGQSAPADRATASRFLAHYGDAEIARRALDLAPPDALPDLSPLRAKVARRAATEAQVRALEETIAEIAR